MRGRPFQLFMLVWALAALLLVRRLFVTDAVGETEPATPVAVSGATDDARDWFERVERHCLDGEIERAFATDRAPRTFEGVAFEAACLALGGAIDEARVRIEGLEAGQRWHAAGIVFERAHPIADGGDEIAVGPVMELVVDIWPNHHQALYHAGAARYQLGDHEAARDYLARFLAEYRVEDAWTRDARSMMAEIAAGKGR